MRTGVTVSKVADLKITILRKVINSTPSCYQYEKEPTIGTRDDGSRINQHTYVWQWPAEELGGELLELVATTEEEPDLRNEGTTLVTVHSSDYDVYLDNVNVTPAAMYNGFTLIIIPNDDGRLVYKLADSLPF